MVEIDKLFAQLKAKESGEYPSQGWVEATIYYPDGAKKAELKIKQDTPEQECETINKLLQNEPSLKLSNIPEILLSEVIEKYCDENSSIDNKWSEQTTKENKSTFALFSRIIGEDVAFSTLQYKELRSCKEKFLIVPSNINKNKLYRDKTIEQVLQMDDVKPMARNTQNKHLNRVHSLFALAVKQGYTDQDYASGLTIGKDKDAQDARDPFTNDDLVKLFESPEYQKHDFKHPYHYWVPLIGLYTGARLNEICQLHLEDLEQINNGLYVFNFNCGSEDKTVKTRSSSRIIPIHSKLIDLGLIT